MRKKNAGADKPEKSCNRLDHHEYPCPRSTGTTSEAAQSKGFRAGFELARD
jgi:hypothetical protein